MIHFKATVGKELQRVRSEFLAVTRVIMVFLWILAPCKLVSRFQNFSSSALKMKAIFLTETLSSAYDCTRCQNPEENHRMRDDLDSQSPSRAVSRDHNVWPSVKLAPHDVKGTLYFLCSPFIFSSSFLPLFQRRGSGRLLQGAFSLQLVTSFTLQVCVDERSIDPAQV